jgi:capsid protein
LSEYQEYFNKTAIKALATTAKNGNPNVCLCGSAFMIDESTIIAASGFFDQTEKNIRETNKAVFMAFQPLASEYWKHYEETGQQQFPAGIRFYCILKETATGGRQVR